MTPAHLHLIFNHYPLVLALVAVVLLALAQRPERTQLLKAGLWVAIFATLTVLPTYFSGEGAEELVEDMPHVSHSLIHEHEEMAEKALIAFLAMGGLAVAALVRLHKGFGAALLPAHLTLVALLVCLALVALTANLGGKVSHPEMRDGAKTEQHDHEESEHIKHEVEASEE